MAEGSYTVEAAFLVPMILGIAFALMTMLFVLHDRVILQANVKNAVFLTVEKEWEDTDLTEDAADSSADDFDAAAAQNLWCMKIESAQISEGVLKVQAEAKGSAVFDIPVMRWFLAAQQESQAKVSYSTLQPEQVLRGTELLTKEDKEKEGDSDGGVETG